jgi:ParB-like chromosome segregation protein Spo0J
MAKKTDGSAASVASFKGLFLDPNDIMIIGVDLPDDACPELADPDRVDLPVNEGLGESIILHGIKQAILVRTIEYEGTKYTVAEDGRQRIKAARECNTALRDQGSDALIKVPCIQGKGDMLSGMIVANEYRTDDSNLAKARKAERLRVYGHSEQDILTHFGGISLLTLKNWQALLNCTPEIQAKINTGEITASAGYELGRLPKAKQAAAITEGAKPDEIRQRARQERTGTPAQTGPKPNLRAIGELYALLEPSEADEDLDEHQSLAFAVLGIVLGQDPSGEGLEDWPSVHKLAKKVLKSKVVRAS